MNYSTQVANDNISWNTLKEIAITVDQGRWHTLWNYDHIVPPFAELMTHVTDDLEAFEEGDVFEGWSILAAWAALTNRVRLGTLVTAMPFRNAALLAKMAATVDHISQGRLDLGLGAAWHVGETRAYGIPLGGAKEKLDRFEEGLEVIRLLFSPEKRSNFQGQYYQLDNAPFAPLSLQKKLPLLIGGGGEKRTLKLVAKYADTYNFFGNTFSSAEEYSHKNRVLDKHCQDIGRDPKEIGRSVCLFAGIENDEAQAAAKREFLGKPFSQSHRDNILIGSAQRIVDGVGSFLDACEVEIDEIIFCGLDANPEAYQAFDEEVLAALGSKVKSLV